MRSVTFILAVLAATAGNPGPASAHDIAVGTPLTQCAVPVSSCGLPATYLLPGQYLAQGFTLPGLTHVGNIYFNFAEIAVPPNPDDPVQISYPNLTFTMSLTDAIGSTASAADVLATSSLSFGGQQGQTEVMSLDIDQTLAAQTYYLVASTNIPIPNAAAVLGWLEYPHYVNDAGQALGASGNANQTNDIWSEMQGCSGSGCRPDVNLPAGSAFIPVSGPAAAPPFQFQVCSMGRGGDKEGGCGVATPYPPPAAPELDAGSAGGALTLLAGLMAVGRQWRHGKRAHLDR